MKKRDKKKCLKALKEALEAQVYTRAVVCLETCFTQVFAQTGFSPSETSAFVVTTERYQRLKIKPSEPLPKEKACQLLCEIGQEYNRFLK